MTQRNIDEIWLTEISDINWINNGERVSNKNSKLYRAPIDNYPLDIKDPNSVKKYLQRTVHLYSKSFLEVSEDVRMIKEYLGLDKPGGGDEEVSPLKR